MEFSYWENNSLLKTHDYTIIGSGIVGLTTAIFLKRKYPTKSIVIYERGFLPTGASTKNAGFACFGSLGELLDDIKTSSQEDIIKLLIKRKKGLDELIKLLGKDNIDLQINGGYELFQPNKKEEYEVCLSKIEEINKVLHEEFGSNVYETVDNTFGFKNIYGIIKNNFEGQIDTGKMMNLLILLAKTEGIEVVNGVEVNSIQDTEQGVSVLINNKFKLTTLKLIICTNGFAKQFLPSYNVEPARAQVLITKPIDELKFKGTFHYNKGYYYFRNIHNRILIGGGRNLNFEAENTTEMICTDEILNSINKLLKEIVLPNTKFEIDYSWSGIMGVGNSKEPFINYVSDNVICGVKLGGMGVALGTLVGKEITELL